MIKMYAKSVGQAMAYFTKGNIGLTPVFNKSGLAHCRKFMYRLTTTTCACGQTQVIEISDIDDGYPMAEVIICEDCYMDAPLSERVR